MPRRGKELSPTLRSRICELHSVGYGYKRIHQIHPEVPVSTIRYTIKKEADRHDNKSMSRPGQPKKLSEEQRKQIYETVTSSNPNISNSELLASVGNAVKLRSLQYVLREMRVPVKINQFTDRIAERII
jgi:transposase